MAANKKTPIELTIGAERSRNVKKHFDFLSYFKEPLLDIFD